MTRDLPDPEGATRFIKQLQDGSPAAAAKLLKNDSLSSDVLALVSFSPLLATTLLQNPEYLWWLDRKRREPGVRSKDELLESLGQFTLTNSQLEPQVLFARFRRRELLRIYLRDIRRLATIAEITEEISVLADSILEAALQLAKREMDNRFGQPLEEDRNGRFVTARFCVIALGKLGSRELNYSSDIDLLFVYSNDGHTSGRGSRGAVTNREYFVKLSEFLTKLVGHPSGEGAAYRVDLRLRPHGSLGPLAQSLSDLSRYYETDARAWERQVMIRSRGCAGNVELFREFFQRVQDLIFSKDETPASALRNVRLSKERINEQRTSDRGTDIKLSSGGIREIEFIAQALQLAYGGRDTWLRAPHTLISLDRLKDRGLITESELTQLSSAYKFLRRVEHILQMENGVQTHTIPNDPQRRQVLARRVAFAGEGELEKCLLEHTANVSRIFTRVLPKIDEVDADPISVEKFEPVDSKRDDSVVEQLRAISPHFASIAGSHPGVLRSPVAANSGYSDVLRKAIESAKGDRTFRARLGALREWWLRCLLGIVTADAFREIDLRESKRRQTELAEASIAAGLEIVRLEMESKYDAVIPDLDLSILALGKLGGGGVDYDSDLDLIFVYDENSAIPVGTTHVEFFSRATELFVTTMSSMTREGSLYRVDLRLRPYGSKGLSAMAADAFLQYIGDKAAIWEMLAFVKLRAVGGDMELGTRVENQTRSTIHERATAADPDDLRLETMRVRDALEEQRAHKKRGGDVDIKYGAGGMLDVYFAMRYLQLRYNVPDNDQDRSTAGTLEALSSVLSDPSVLMPLNDGYHFLSRLDHAIRLTVGRITRLPSGNVPAMELIAKRLEVTSPAELIEQLTIHRLAIRDAYEQILSAKE
jgi:glutamine synthetase adenylyltransferase